MHLVHLRTNDPDVNQAYYTAFSDLVANIKPFRGGIHTQDREVIIAGIGYVTPWTRDAAINTLFAGSLLCPKIARNTLESVLTREDTGLRIGGEYWDAIIWVWGAWEYWRVTGDREFLEMSYEAACNSLRYFENTEFDPVKNLFRGPACFADGVAAYPDIYATPGQSGIVSFATDRRDLCVSQGVGIPCFALSTNCLYYHAYRLADRIGALLGKPSRFASKASALHGAIQAHFWMEGQGLYRYLVDPFGGSDRMEGIGHAFAILLGVADAEQTQKILGNQHITPHGIPCLWPTFRRYAEMGEGCIGRHSGTVWPHVQAFWADAALQNGAQALFNKEFRQVTDWAVRDGHLAELFHPDTGAIYGGIQEKDNTGITSWVSQKKQTWSATGYLHMVFFNLLGIRFEDDCVRFDPYLPEGITDALITDLCIRGKLYSFRIQGSGKNITQFLINGSESRSIPLI